MQIHTGKKPLRCHLHGQSHNRNSFKQGHDYSYIIIEIIRRTLGGLEENKHYVLKDEV